MKKNIDKLEEIYKTIKRETIDNTIYNLVISDERKNIKYSPSYQRNYIWNSKKAINLIETILLKGIIPPMTVIKVGKEILKALGLRKGGLEFVSCPTCGRTQIDLINIANQVEKRLESVNKNIKVAVMGCVVNGPGEAREADIGIAGGKGEGIIFKKGKIIKKVKEEDLIEELMKEIESL